MKNKSIMFWVIVTLVVIGALPFLLSWYQIKLSKEAVIDQAQKNHLIISRATADRIDAYVQKHHDLALNVANNPEVYLVPDSEESAEALKSALLLRDDVMLISLLHQTNGETQVIQMAHKPNIDGDVLNQLLNQSNPFQLLNFNNNEWLAIRTASARPNVDVLVLTSIEFDQWLNPRVLGESAVLNLIDSNANNLVTKNPVNQNIPINWLPMLKNGAANGGVNRSNQGDENREIASFAKVGDLPWYVTSRQSVEIAEQATHKMSQTAWTTFSIVLLVMAALLAMAYFSWVKPIRRIVHAQKQLIGDSGIATDWQGGEVSALEHSFEALTKHINDRNALGQVFVDRYQVISPIGKGGMGSVFLGWDPKLDRHVALKTLPIGYDFETRENMSQSLVQEAITAAQISHRNVVSIYDVVSTQKTAFIAMEYIKGESLHSLLKRKETLNMSLTLAIAIAVLRGLHSAHKMGFVHRDIKPANIMLDVNGDIKLTDFGTTTLVSGLENDKITGTSGYMAPETYDKGAVSTQSDLFAVGVVFAECLLGHNPFRGKKLSQTKHNTLHESVEFPKYLKSPESKNIFKVLELMLHKDPDKRPKSAVVAAELIVKNAPCPIHWDADVAGVKVHRNDSNYETEDTIVAHS